jgi:hypothetical protein
MQVLRLNEVLMRVVAWHNRHPLARRISAAQVHSIGEVLLPFAASAPALTLSPGANGLPEVADLPDPPPAVTVLLPAQHRPADPVLADDTLRVAPESVPDAATTATAAAADADADADPALHLAADALDLALPLEPQATQPLNVTQSLHATPAIPLPAPHAATAAATAADTAADTVSAPPSRLKRLLARLTGRQPGMPRLQSTFSRDFIWPLSPRRVARWARGHGQLQPVAPADWPRRVVETDGALQVAARQKGLAHAVELHVLTAAIGVGDRRLRVLMDAQGAVIGPRAYSRSRLAAAGGLVATALLGLGWSTLRPLLPNGSAVLALAAATSASAASAPAGAASSAALAALAALAEPGASASSSAEMAAAAASAPGGAASDSLHADAAAAASPEATAPAAHPAETQAAGPATARPPTATARTSVAATATATATPAAAPAAAPAATPAAAPAAAPAATPAAAPAPSATAAAAAGKSAPLGRIRPTLSDDDKQAARAQTAALRGDKAEPPRAAAAATATAPVYAVVTRPSPQREVASAGLAVMQRAGGRLPPSALLHGELMQNQGAWRAAWWPFASLADAERARVLLAGKGLKVEVVEF